MPFVPNTGNTSDSLLANFVPSQSGLGTRTGRLPAERTAIVARKMIHWLVPEGPIVQMYINPKNINYTYAKHIPRSRTKGGFVVHYWGEDLIVLNISGTTGTSGIEGINVLHDIYRNEQLAYDPYALYQSAQNKQNASTGDIFGINSALSNVDSFGEGANSILGDMMGAATSAFPTAANQGPTLASLATQVEMYWSGEVFRGFFENFKIIEGNDNIGMFNYEMQFIATQRRGLRRNFFAWHKSPVYGPSNSDPEFGPPHSYGTLIEGAQQPVRRAPQPDVLSELETIGKGFSSLGDIL